MSQPPNETVRDEAQALALLCARGVLSLTHAPGLVSLVEAVAGAPVAGSWWSHPAGDLIYQLVTALEEAKDVLGAKVAAGKMAFVHRRLWPALVRVLKAHHPGDNIEITYQRGSVTTRTQTILTSRKDVR